MSKVEVLRNICFMFAVSLGFVSLKAGTDTCKWVMGITVILIAVSIACELARYLSSPKP